MIISYFILFGIYSQVILCYQYLFHNNRPFPIELNNRDIIFSNNSGLLNNFLIFYF